MYAIDSVDRVLQFSSVSFDASMEQIFCALCNGATLVLRGDEMAQSSREFLNSCRQEQISVVNLPTAYWHVLVADLKRCSLEIPDCVRLVIVGGDRMSFDKAVEWAKIAPHTRLMNAYGPTETTITSTLFEISNPLDALTVSRQDIPIGCAVSGTLHVLDEEQQPVPIGVAGELWISGDRVARGYLGRPDLTAERFRGDPFDADGSRRMYRTGDLVRRREDGNLEYLGRFDNQVKIRGFRIELGEIEKALRAHPDVDECAVMVDKVTTEEKRLVAYISGDNLTHPAAVRDFLSQELPDYMVPAAIVQLQTLPLNANGKIDRDALAHVGSAAAVEPSPPDDAVGSVLEQQLAVIWEELLGVTNVKYDQDFFDLGGDSLGAVQLLGRIEERFGFEPPIREFFQEPTIAHLAAVMLRRRHDQIEQGVVAFNVDGTRPPFFFFHGDLHGGGLYARVLVSALHEDQPCYVISPHGTDDTLPPETFEEMAQKYVSLIRARQPVGPYRLGGFCNGAICAFEVARILRSQHERVERLILVAPGARNPWLVEIARTLRHLCLGLDLTLAQRRRWIMRLCSYIWQWDELAEMPPWQRGRSVMILARRIFARKAPDEDQRVGKLAPELTELYDLVMQLYRPSRYDGPLTLLFPKDSPAKESEPVAARWRAVSNHAEVRAIPGDHFSCLTRHGATLADMIVKMLA
jgi:aspartate racemase